MRYPISHTVLALLMLILSACTTAPKKPVLLPNTQVNKLQMMRLDSRLPVPIKGISRTQLRDTWGAARSQGVVMKALTSWRNVVRKCIVPLRA